ncbi:beta-ketoacyl synthase N-terminal-like domain-containing protein [Fluviispira vulneris]|uniref:beta-ketoacyl synthase N-terminal-like domain-containing protein n=1 Tax=Fluviispira vulneris TaxID=2763012 RepID=UPI001644DE76|nr:beta-ketoacyl synthase N-terminal-like domain-containing protein [Fluviispira vulneris]
MSKSSCPAQNARRKVFLYAASVVAPGASNLNEFLDMIAKGKSVLSLKESLSNAFLVGAPKFDFSVYKNWLEERHGPKRYSLLNDKSGDLVKYGVGSLIDAISANPALEKAIKILDPKVTIQYATGLADLPVNFQAAREFDESLFKWNSFWADPKRNQACADHLNKNAIDPHAPEYPASFAPDSYERIAALKNWNAYWCKKSSLFEEYLTELKAIESQPVVGNDIESAKLGLIRGKTKARKELYEKYKFPTPPWESISPNLLWNIPNVAASQVSMLLNLHGTSSGSSAACASFGALIDNAMLEIQSGRTDLAIIGAVDANPTNELVSAFYAGRLAVLGDSHGVPFCDLRGTHISGGACTWIIAAEDAMQKFEIQPMPVEILGAGVSSDAEHIITPSKEGPKLAIRRAFAQAQIDPSQIQLWDMHATGTPGDWNEFCLIDEFVPKKAYISARKGIFGHGMCVGGGWELTAQLLGTIKTGAKTYNVMPSGIDPAKVNPKIASLDRNLLLDKIINLTTDSQGIYCGKLSMGLGGTSSCVIARVN